MKYILSINDQKPIMGFFEKFNFNLRILCVVFFLLMHRA